MGGSYPQEIRVSNTVVVYCRSSKDISDVSIDA